MPSEETSEGMKAIILKLLKTIEELKYAVSPLIKGQDLALRAIASHEELLKELMQQTTGLSEHQETIQKKLGDLDQCKFDQEMFRELEKRVSQLEEASADAIMQKLKSNLKIGNIELAKFENLANRTKKTEFFVMLGIIYGMRNANEKAIGWFDRAITLEADNPHALCQKGVALAKLGRNEEALEVFEKVKGEKCYELKCYKARTLAAMGKYEQALNITDLALAQNDKDAWSWALKGRILFDSKRITEAIGCLEKALEIDSKLVSALFDKGLALLKLGNNYAGEALKCFEQTAQLEPDEYENWYNKGTTLQMLDRAKEAIESYSIAIKLNPKDGCTYCLRAGSEMSIEDFPAALVDVCKAIELGPPDDCGGTVYYVRATVFRSRKKYTEALEDCEHAISSDNKDPDYWALKASILIDMGRKNEVKDVINNAIKLNPTDGHSLNSIAYNLYRIGCFSEGEAFARKAVEEKPEDVYYIDTLACILAKMEKNTESLTLFEKALSIRKKDSQITWNELADLYERIGRREDASKIRASHIKDTD